MTEVFIDIENTIIESLDNPEFLDNNCHRITNFLKRLRRQGGDISWIDRVHLNTWGWKTAEEIDWDLVDDLFNKLGVNAWEQGEVFTKVDGVNTAIHKGWLNEVDKERALFPGMMKEFGISKVSCFCNMVEKPDTTFVLIDDLVDIDEEINRPDKIKIQLFNPKSLK